MLGRYVSSSIIIIYKPALILITRITVSSRYDDSPSFRMIAYKTSVYRHIVNQALASLRLHYCSSCLPSNWKKSQNESGLAIGSRVSCMGSCEGLYVDTPLGTREKKFSSASRVPVSLERTMESVIHCSNGLSRASSYCENTRHTN